MVSVAWAQRKEWAEKHPEEYRAQKRKWYDKNKAKIQAKNKAISAQRVEAHRKYYKRNPDKQHEKTLRHYHRITLADYNAMLAAQNGECRICRVDHKDCLHGKLHVDHCHLTKKIRGLLCGNCNRMLGLAKDKAANLLSAVRYLAETGGAVGQH